MTSLVTLNIIYTFTSCKASKYGVSSAPYFIAFGLNMEIYGVNIRIQSECGEIWTPKKLRIWTRFTQWLLWYLNHWLGTSKYQVGYACWLFLLKNKGTYRIFPSKEIRDILRSEVPLHLKYWYFVEVYQWDNIRILSITFESS